MMYIRLRTGLECQGRVEHWKRRIQRDNRVKRDHPRFWQALRVSEWPASHHTDSKRHIVRLHTLCPIYLDLRFFFFSKHWALLKTTVAFIHPSLHSSALQHVCVCVCARCFPPLSQSMPNHIKSLIKLFWGSNSKSYRRCVSGNMQHLFSPFSFFASAHLWLMQRQRIASRKSNTCWFDYCLQIMQIKGCVTNAQGWPTLHSWWGLILRASGLHLAVHSTVCTQMFAFWNYTLELNHAYMQSAGTSPASIFTDICKSISVVSLFIRDLHIKILRWN